MREGPYWRRGAPVADERTSRGREEMGAYIDRRQHRQVLRRRVTAFPFSTSIARAGVVALVSWSPLPTSALNTRSARPGRSAGTRNLQKKINTYRGSFARALSLLQVRYGETRAENAHCVPAFVLHRPTRALAGQKARTHIEEIATASKWPGRAL